MYIIKGSSYFSINENGLKCIFLCFVFFFQLSAIILFSMDWQLLQFYRFRNTFKTNLMLNWNISKNKRNQLWYCLLICTKKNLINNNIYNTIIFFCRTIDNSVLRKNQIKRSINFIFFCYICLSVSKNEFPQIFL